MIVELGIGIILFGIGLFIGKLFKNDSDLNIGNNKLNIFQKWIVGIKRNMKIKREDNAQLKRLKRAARMEAFEQLQPVLVQHIKEQEIKKLTGEDKKEKLAKFVNGLSFKSDAISKNDGGFNVEEKLHRMIGKSNNLLQPKKDSNLPEKNHIYNSRGRTISQSPQRKKKSKINQYISESGYDFGNSFSQNKINKMLGKKEGKQKTVEDKLHDILG